MKALPNAKCIAGASGQKRRLPALRVHVGSGWEAFSRIDPAFEGTVIGASHADTQAEDFGRVRPASLVEAAASDRLARVLQSGRFEVTGFVSFAPMQPFQPREPRFTAGATLAEAKQGSGLYAFEQIGGIGGYTYPDDA